MSLVVGNYYSFDTHAPVVLRKSYTTMQLLGVLVYAEALNYDPTIPSKHTTVRAYNQDITADSVNTTEYYLFLDQNNQKLVFNKEWIVAATLNPTIKYTATLIIRTEDLEAAIALLKTAGVEMSVG